MLVPTLGIDDIDRNLRWTDDEAFNVVAAYRRGAATVAFAAHATMQGNDSKVQRINLLPSCRMHKAY